MVLTKGDDFPLHQTPEPIAYAGTDRNFHDRYFFNGYQLDGSGFFAAAFGVYPHLNIADAHFSVVRDGVQYCLHVSRELNMERLDLSCGPIRIEILEPLQKLRIVVDGEGIKADLTFTGRAFPIEEPRFTLRTGPRTFMDLTRMTQNGRYAGWVEIDRVRLDLAPGTIGTRDRSWGVRPVGTRDQQPHPGGEVFTFFWQWVPVHFADRTILYHVNQTAEGNAWNTSATIVPDGATADDLIKTAGTMQSSLQPGTRWPEFGTLTLDRPKGAETLKFEVLGRFQMRGIGYTSPIWGHGLYHGPLAVERENFELAQCDPARMDRHHVQMPCRVISDNWGEGIGAFEQLIVGPYEPFGLKDFTDLG